MEISFIRVWRLRSSPAHSSCVRKGSLREKVSQQLKLGITCAVKFLLLKHTSLWYREGSDPVLEIKGLCFPGTFRGRDSRTMPRRGRVCLSNRSRDLSGGSRRGLDQHNTVSASSGPCGPLLQGQGSLPLTVSQWFQGTGVKATQGRKRGGLAGLSQSPS